METIFYKGKEVRLVYFSAPANKTWWAVQLTIKFPVKDKDEEFHVIRHTDRAFPTMEECREFLIKEAEKFVDENFI